MIAGALALVGLGTWGHLNPQHFVWVGRLVDHVYVFGVIAVLLTAWALARLTGRRWLQVLLVVPAVLVAGLWALFGIFLADLFGTGDVQATADAPHGSYTAVVRLSYVDAPDPAWILSIQQTGSLTAREFEVGCISGDDPQYSFRGVRWADDEHLIVRVVGHTATVEVDHLTGVPRPVSGGVWNC